MILFKDDWLKYPNAIVDLNTRSQSALKTAKVFKKMGVDNHAFLLQLHNPVLSGVDVYKETSNELKLLIGEELAINPWYYFREVAMAPPSGGIEPVPFRLNRANTALYWLFYNSLTTMLIQCRQTGKTLSVEQLTINLLEYYTMNSAMGLFTKDSSLRTKNIEELKSIMDTLPDWLDFRTKHDSNNTVDITVSNKHNILNTAVGQPTKAAAGKVFRGDTKPIITIDEAAFIINIGISLSSLLPSMIAARDNASASGLPNGLVLTTTAGYLDTESGKYMHDNYYKKAARFSEKMYDSKNKSELINIVEKNGIGKRNQIVLVEMNHRDLGYSDEWLERKLAETNSSGATAEAEFLLRWVSGKITSALTDKLIKRLNNSAMTPAYTEISETGFALNWYINKEQVEALKNEPTIIGIDSSDAVGNDSIGINISNYKSGRLLGAGKYSLANLHQFGLFLFDHMVEHPKSTLIIERRSSAMGILDQLANLFQSIGVSIFKRVFNWVVDDKDQFPDRFLEVDQCPINNLHNLYIKHKKTFGFGTSGAGRTSRDVLFGRSLIECVDRLADNIFDKDTIHQLVLLELKNGRVDHKHNEHDDLVIALLLVYFFLTKSKNMDYYGFNPSLALSQILTGDKSAIQNIENNKESARKSDILEEIANLIESISSSTNKSDEFMTTARIIKLKRDIGDESISGNIDTMLKDKISKIDKSRHNNKINLYSLY